MQTDIIILKINILQMLFIMIFVNCRVGTRNTEKNRIKCFYRAKLQLFKLISKTLSINQ